MIQSYRWEFPLNRTHAGALLGNGVMGVIVWGGGGKLCLTLGRADFWDHRGGGRWNDHMSYATIRELLEKRDEKSLRRIFEETDPAPGEPRQPSILPIGRLEVHLPAQCRLRAAQLHFETGMLDIIFSDAEHTEQTMTCTIDRSRPAFGLRMPERMEQCTVTRVTSRDYLEEKLAAISLPPPTLFDTGTCAGWVQGRVVDEPLCIGYRLDNGVLWAVMAYGGDEELARVEAEGYIAKASEQGFDGFAHCVRSWWSGYWRRVPAISVPNDTLAFLYRYGMYKFAGLTDPAGVPATLQGPWIEEFRMPPWSCDYHFNINVQMCYWPAYQGNLLEWLRPLFDMIWSWRDTLRENARLFIGVEDGYLLPHAVDDRCRIESGFWSGTIDHACTAWVGKMMYDYWLYGGDEQFLREVAFPFMTGAVRVYQAMLERRNGEYVLPVSVSPEYRANQIDAWGKNASFQLAALHWLLEALQDAAETLHQAPDPAWAVIQTGLPRACVQSPDGKPKIMLWEGTDLEESHRHHSHMAGWYPFDILDSRDKYWRGVLAQTYQWWNVQGMGLWSGWCIPWAAMLHARAGSPDMTEAMLEYMDRIYTNEGRGTLHDPNIFGLNLGGRGPDSMLAGERAVHEAPMQMDAGMAATAAVMDALVHVRRGIHYLFPGSPARWRRVSFERVLTAGAFTVSASRTPEAVDAVTIEAGRDATMRLHNPWSVALRPRVSVRSATKVDCQSDIIEIPLRSGETASCTIQ